MRISLNAVGRMKTGPERELVTRYLDRAKAMGSNLGLTGFGVTEIPESRAGSAAARKRDEARALLAACPQKAGIVVLDEAGKSFGSAQFARTIAGWRDTGRTGVVFIIGGADGLSQDMRKSAGLVLSFSPLTWPHQLVRIMLAEQLYRVTTLLAGHPYHRQ